MTKPYDGLQRERRGTPGESGRLVMDHRRAGRIWRAGLAVTAIAYPDNKRVRIRDAEGRETIVAQGIVDFGIEVFVDGCWHAANSPDLLDYYEAQVREHSASTHADEPIVQRQIAFYLRALRKGGRKGD